MGTLSEHIIESQDSTQRKGNIYFASICLWDKRIEGLLPKGLTQFSDDPGLTNYYDPVNNPEHDPRFFEEPKRKRTASIDKLADWLIKDWYDTKGSWEGWDDLHKDVWTRWISDPVRWRKFGRNRTWKSSFQLTVDLTDLRPTKNRNCPSIVDLAQDPNRRCEWTYDRRNLAREALKTWSSVTGIKFKEVNRNADITFGDQGSEFSDWGGPGFQVFDELSPQSFSNVALTYVDEVNRPSGNYWNWINDVYVLIHHRFRENENKRNERIFQTYIHEIGHALGLGHPGGYNSNESYCRQTEFTNDSHALSLMSYWPQSEAIDAKREDTNKLVVTPNVVDLRAFDRIYHDKVVGTINAFPGNTIYGHQTNIAVEDSHHYARMRDNAHRFQYTIVDRNVSREDIDRIDFSWFDSNGDGTDDSASVSQTIDLRASSPRRSQPFFSSVGGGSHNLNIAINTTIEHGVAGRGNDRLVGNSVSNELYGHDGNDTLIGGKGTDHLFGDGQGYSARNTHRYPEKEWGNMFRDSMAGGEGDDYFYVNHPRDITQERANEGHDIIYSSARRFTMGNNIEELWPIRKWRQLPKFHFIGNDIDNTIYGWRRADRLSGKAGDDILYAYGGDDTLKGGAGRDRLIGSVGDDLYIIDSDDTIEELVDEGIDTVQIENQSIRIPDNIENAEVIHNLAATIEVNGNELANRISGSSRRLRKLRGLEFFGLAGDDTLVGSVLSDTLNGGSGSDSMIGKSGNDVYYLDSINDKVVEVANDGVDKIYTNRFFSLFVTPHVENIELQGSSNVGLTGNNLGNILTGNLGHNVLLGGDGDDSLVGGFGNDSLDGGAGSDTLFGGAGRDVYTITGLNDVIQESEMNTDVDHIKSFVSISLSAQRWGQVSDIENLSLMGEAAAYGYGNALDNRIIGNSKANTLIGLSGLDVLTGGPGADVLTGGADSDTFKYLTVDDSPRDDHDVIRDFSQNDFDVIDLTAIDANKNLPGDQNFQFSTTQTLVTPAGTAIFNESTKMLNLYTDNTVLPTMTIHVPSVDFIRSSDLYL